MKVDAWLKRKVFELTCFRRSVKRRSVSLRRSWFGMRSSFSLRLDEARRSIEAARSRLSPAPLSPFPGLQTGMYFVSYAGQSLGEGFKSARKAGGHHTSKRLNRYHDAFIARTCKRSKNTCTPGNVASSSIQ